MKNTKFEFCVIEIEYLNKIVLNDINLKRLNKEIKSEQEASYVYLTNHGLERLAFAGSRGWEIKSVNRVNTDIGVSDIYYLQRSSEHERFGNEFKIEYMDSKLREDQESAIKKVLTRDI